MDSTPYQDLSEAARFYVERLKLPLVVTYGRRSNGSCACPDHDCTASPYKHPVRGSGHWTRDPEKIVRWIGGFTDCGLQMNLGVAGFIDLDLDVEHREDFRTELAQLEADLGSLPPTWTVLTPNGGEHRLFTPSGPLDGLKENTRLGDHKHIEFKIGGTCPLPPSRHYSGPEYRWKPGLLLEPAPREYLRPRTSMQSVLRRADLSVPLRPRARGGMPSALEAASAP